MGQIDITLCCILHSVPGQATALSAYEDKVLRLVQLHGGRVLQRAIGNDPARGPAEVQFFRFPDQASVDAYMADPARLALADERKLSVARTEVFPVRFHQP